MSFKLETVDVFHKVIAAGDTQKIEDFVKSSGGNARLLLDTASSHSGYTALSWSCYSHCDASVLAMLLKFSPGVEARGDDDESPLYTACFNRLPEQVRLLIGAGAKVNSENTRDKETPLHVAARFGFVSIADILLKSGSDINMTNRMKESALFLASKMDRYDMVYFLLSNDANKVIADQDGKNPLYIASEKGNKHCVGLLRADKKELRAAKAHEDVEMKDDVKPLPTEEEISRRIIARKEAELEERKADAIIFKSSPAPAPAPAAAARPIEVAPKIEYDGEKKVRTHDPFTGKALGPVRTLDEVGYTKPVEIPAGLDVQPVAPTRIGGTSMVVGTGTEENIVQPPHIVEGDLEPDGPMADFVSREALRDVGSKPKPAE